ncbi:hypothetical protein [Mobiluncus mulieris]|uniref:hypothetical protein n=1 Tax=Mobiluncus mulieris TaxID=2052 RepID=UPI0020920B2C|nr:hypothetical protein [Mobiluncus mulieris]
MAGEYETAAGGLGYDDPDFDTQLMNPASARLQNTFDEAKARSRGDEGSPPGRTPQRARLAPTPRVATLVAVFLLAIGGLVVGWQVLSAPPSQPVPGTVETGVGQGSALQAAGTGSRVPVEIPAQTVRAGLAAAATAVAVVATALAGLMPRIRRWLASPPDYYCRGRMARNWWCMFPGKSSVPGWCVWRIRRE